MMTQIAFFLMPDLIPDVMALSYLPFISAGIKSCEHLNTDTILTFGGLKSLFSEQFHPVYQTMLVLLCRCGCRQAR